MNRLPRLLTLAGLLCCWPVVAFTQTANPASEEVMRQLLSMPAPAPRTAKAPTDTEPKQTRPEKFFYKDNPPPNDAPVEDLLLYWNRWADTPQRPQLSDIAQQRLLEACADDIEQLPGLISLFSKDESTAKKIKELFDKAVSDQRLDNSSREKVKKWLIFNSKYYLSELLALASKVKDNEKGGWVHNEEALVALARVNWQAAEPLINALADGSQPRSSAVALALLYQQAISEKDLDAEEKYRNRLKTIASDRNARAHARDTSIKALSVTEWSGRDDWYLSLLADDSLRESHDGIYGYHSLTKLFDRDPKKWIPVMTKLVDSKDRVVQQAAASCLVIYATSHPRRDAILPVLRWLSDPDWLHLSGQRASFMQKMDELEIPESVPGLIWIVENEEHNKQWAARTLAYYKDPRAVPALKKALAQSNENERKHILEGLFASGGISDSEAMTALEAYATMRMTAEGREEVDLHRVYHDEPLPVPISIGKYLATTESAPETLVRSVLARAESLKKTNPMMAQSLFEIANRWQNRQVDLDMIQRIASGTADANTIATALGRRNNLRENLEAELQVILQQSGEPLGIGSILLNDPHLAQSILTAEDHRAKIALLAGARLTQTSLPVELVGALLTSKNSLLASAAEFYLLAEDSKEAQKLLWQHHPNQAFVTGWRDDNFDQMVEVEEKLRAELFKADAPLEIFALVSDDERHRHILRIYADRAIYTQSEDPARYLERVVSQAELSAFKDFVTTAGVRDLGPQFGGCHNNCSTLEFLALKKDEARRVFGRQAFSDWGTIETNFDLLGRGEGAKVRYTFENEIKGLEILYEDAHLEVKDVWQRGDEIRIFVERQETEAEYKQRIRSNDDSDEDDEAAYAERQRKKLAQRKARVSWRKLTGNKAGAVVAQPDSYSTFDESNFLIESDRYNAQEVQMLSADTIVITRNFDGLWKQTAGSNAVRISEGAYSDPLVTPDGKWVVVAKADGDWGKPNYIVRFNLNTGREFRINVSSADVLYPVMFLPLHSKVLVRRMKDEDGLSARNSSGPERPEHYLLDAATGDIQLVSGEFAPLRQGNKRFLQSTGKPDEYWAAIPNERRNQTQVGRYNIKDFSFKPVLVIPHISFDSMSMWVDESRNKLYLVYNFQLLRLPLKSAVESN